MTEMDTRTVRGKREMLMTVSIEPYQPASAFGAGDFLELPEMPGALLRVAACEVYRNPVTGAEVPGYRLMQFAEPAGMLPLLLPATAPLLARLMLRRWPDFPCMLCRRKAAVQHDMVAYGRVTGRVCAACA
ncbi:hypothetical protein ABZT26_25865 [Streptomyces sp. NPDC005395]|uniref:hypothetical protein n=1 Tax=Streptomyces sp. NPDC005395 TaxID=3157042 RepID=UPI0033A42762